MSKEVEVYTNLERFFHMHMMHLMTFLVISGLPILSDSFDIIAYMVGVPISALTHDQNVMAAGFSFLRSVHYISAFIMTILLVPFLLTMVRKFFRLNLWPDRWGLVATVDGFKQMYKHYIKQEHATFGKMNIGQKMFAWTVIFCMIAIIVSGYILIFRDSFSTDVASCARGVHAVAFVVIGVFLIIHMYLATHPANKSAYKAMFKTGKMDVDTIKDHHGLYYDKLKKEGKVE
jgi:formate dehydrogenase subunit gamma